MQSVRVSASQADLSVLLERAAKSKQRTILSRRGKDVAAVVPMEDLRIIERMSELNPTAKEMNRQDLQEARAALAERGKRVGLRDFLAQTEERR